VGAVPHDSKQEKAAVVFGLRLPGLRDVEKIVDESERLR
jgi:hypothetical protein